MKNTVINTVLILILFTFSNTLWARSQIISLNFDNASMMQVFGAIEAQSGYSFFYDEGEIDLNEKVSLHINDRNLSDVLTILFRDKKLNMK